MRPAKGEAVDLPAHDNETPVGLDLNAGSGVLGTLSREMRTPLNTIIGFSEMMDREILGPMTHPQYREYARDIYRCGQTLLGLLNELLEAKRLETFASGDDDGADNIVELAPDMVCVCHEECITRINPAGAAMVGLPSDTLLGRPFVDLLLPESRALLGEKGVHGLCEHDQRISLVLQGLSGRRVEVELAAGRLQDGSRTGVLIVARDVTDRNTRMKEVVDREEYLRGVMAAVSDGIVTFNEHGVIETANPAAERIFAYAEEDVLGKSIDALIPELRFSGQVGTGLIFSLCDGLVIIPAQWVETQGKRSEGKKFPLEFSISSFHLRDRTHYICVSRNIAMRKQNEDKLRFLATRDPLTHLPNRYMFEERLHQAIVRAKDQNENIAVMFIDLDNFKNINDAMGHSTGDAVLRLAAERLLSCVDAEDTVARLSGDEFTVILKGVRDEQHTAAIAEKMLETLSLAFHVKNREVFTSGSIGIILCPPKTYTAEEMVKNVYSASHYAKKCGRNNYQFYNASLSMDALRRMAVENGLRKALGNGELELLYQPKVKMGSFEIIGAEALVRWTSSELGSVSPVEFIPVAEQSGLIIPIGDWILETACRQAKHWYDQGRHDVHVAVNLSAVQFRERDLAGRVMQVLSSVGLPPGCLDLELTESMLVDDAEETVAALNRLKKIGVTLSIDDFGTGYSSLSYLTRFPLDALKVDRAFVTGLPDDGDAVTMAKAIVSMAQNLGFKVVAEGIETERQNAFLHALGSDIGQGFLYSRPLPLSAFMALLKNGRPLFRNSPADTLRPRGGPADEIGPHA
ncbi:EAL domain-containing protein [Varunaivibrio sulfuroxidans]|uniref:EAL domain-containing protein n=1 Tax=Varunaivibrio sulfuroxidans TaxID=1773489 RepID=UPI0014046760|nr:EAL domain-containing protein [Varunaivibrio sulfuroxidans]WES30076.1 EAL domain-containing protein [Varunaivibrio sulfuroxidans]